MISYDGDPLGPACVLTESYLLRFLPLQRLDLHTVATDTSGVVHAGKQSSCRIADFDTTHMR